MHDHTPDIDSTPAPPVPRRLRALRAVHGFGRAFALIGAAWAVVLAIVFPALLFRADAARDARILIGLAGAVTWFAAFGMAAWVNATTAPVSRRRTRSPARRIPLRARMITLTLVPFLTYALCAHARAWLAERQDPLYSYCMRGMSVALAQPGISRPTSLDVQDGRLTLVVPAFPGRRARWWVDVDADDTVGRHCTFHAAVTFGEDPMVLHIPLPMASDEMPSAPFRLVPGSMVVVHRLTLTAASDATNADTTGQPGRSWMRNLDLVYEVPAPRGRVTRSWADYVSREGN